MVYQEIFSYAKDFSLLSSTGVEDFADKLNSRYMVMAIWISCLIISVKSYVFNPIVCYLASSLDASNFDSYVTNYCWIHGTIPLRVGEKMPRNDEWTQYDIDRRIYYYQWIVLVLGLQSILFYIPKFFWSFLQSTVAPSDVDEIMKHCDTMSNENEKSRNEHIDTVARTIEHLLDRVKRKQMVRRDSMVDGRRTTRDRTEGLNRIYRLFCVVAIDGKKLPLIYVFVKLLYIANVVSQLFIMKHFIGHETILFGLHLLYDVYTNHGWEHTGHFPRVSYCYCKGIQVLGSSQRYVAQCALPINMLAEKIYIMLWFAMAIAFVATILSLVMWVFRIIYRSSYISFMLKYLRCMDMFQKANEHSYRKFITDFLGPDGVFLLRMVENNTTHVVMVALITRLYHVYRDDYEMEPATLPRSFSEDGGDEITHLNGDTI